MTVQITEANSEVVKAALFLRGDEERQAWDRLLAPDLIDVTVAELTALAVSVNGDLALRAAHQDGYSTDHQEWRRRALGFKSAVDRRLQVAKARQKALNRTRSLEESQSARTVLRELALAVLRHQRESSEADIRPEPHDEALWRALDLLCVPVANDVYTLRHMVTEGVWS
jgi:hypothetical protein